MEIAGKVALVTGGAHRIGRALVLMLAKAGAQVVINYHHSAEAAEATSREVRALGVAALPIQCDISDWGAVQRMAAIIHEQFGGVDLIVNSANDYRPTPSPTDDVTTWQQVTRVALDGPFYIVNSLVASMCERAWQTQSSGVIINLLDPSAWTPFPSMAAHGVGKAGMLALTRQWALDLAPTIRVNAVAPGPVLPPPGWTTPQMQRIADRTLLDRWGDPQDVVYAVRYLVEANYVTGDVLTVDGGERWAQYKQKQSG
jgi:NAD(P)-dependent dehydrogenase (short-subunit alcohol dehydrogenase family)